MRQLRGRETRNESRVERFFHFGIGECKPMAVQTADDFLSILEKSNLVTPSALQQIRKADSDLCVIATSSNPSVGMAVQIMKHQAFHYLKKPVVPDELCDVVKDAIREKGLLVDLETRLNTAIGSRIRERRHSRPLTLKQLANRTGLSVSLISQIELGKSAASMSTLHKLATALQMDMTYFFETV